MDTQVADSLLGSLVDGRYRVTGRVAHGGMATVFTAIDERLGRTVAIKLIHPTRAHDRRFLERFSEEANTIARLAHPNVVAVYDQGVHLGLPYLVMEYVRGRTLREVLAGRDRLQPVETLAILEQMLAAIAAAHRAGVVHRDIKPENVLVAEAPSGGAADLVDCVVKVADFGLARAVAASTDDPAGGQLMATVAYVAPELVTAGHSDPRTDVYAAGIVLFEMLTGRVPFDGGRPEEVAWQHVDLDVPPPSRFVPGLPPVLDALVARTTRRDPAARPSDAGVMLGEVQQVRDGLGTVAPGPGPGPGAPASDATTALPQLSNSTMMVPRVTAGPERAPGTGVYAGSTVPAGQRPSWAQLPSAHPSAGGRRRAAPAGGLAGRLGELRRRVGGAPHSRTALVAALVALSLLAVVGIWYVAFGRYTDAPQLVTMTREQAQQRADQAGLRLRFGTGQYREDVAKDVVLTQDPAAGTRIVKGGTLTLILSLGPERYVVPDVIGKEYDIAAAEIKASNLEPKRGEDKYDSTTPAGNVLSVSPEVNSEVKPGTTVTVTVSKGRPPINVPDVVGKNINEARNTLQQAGLTVTEEQVDSADKPAGEVLEQSPKAGTGVERGAEVKLKVSKGPPLVTVPRVIDMQCQAAKQQLEALGLRVNIQGFDQSTVRFQNPSENTQVQPGSEVTLGCVF